MSVRQIAVALGLIAAASCGYAACDSGLADRMSVKLHPGRVLDEERAACKGWPGVPGRSIVVLPLPHMGTQPGMTEFDLDVLVVQQADNGNTDRSTITSRLFEQNVLLEGADHIEDIRIDTTRYPLAADARAFGVRVRYSASSRENPYASETLRLYVPQGERLRKVLSGLELSMDRGEWDSHCTGTFEQMRGELSIASTRSNGLADLVQHRTLTDSHASFTDGSCTEQRQDPRFETVQIRYDGIRYVLPTKLKRLEATGSR